MRHIRSTWCKRGVVAVLALSLLPLIAGRFAGGGTEAGAAHTTWLRAQITESLPESAQPAVQAALETAAEQNAPTRRAFTEAFADAYLQQDAPVSLAALFAAPDVDHRALYDVLSRRTAELTRSALLPRHSIGTAPAGTSMGRAAGLLLHVPVPTHPSLEQVVGSGVIPERVVPCLIRILSSARPMAP